MLRSLFSGISGLRTNQTMLDVIGNNIANANTIGFKGSTTIFQETLSQTLSGASAVSPPRGGTNPMQVGLGVQIASISTNFGQGSAQTTGRATDLMIQGDGFFVTERGGERFFTRAGAFNFDANGTLVTPTGNRVKGYYVDAAGNANTAGGLQDVVLDDAAARANAQPPVPAGVSIKSYSIGSDGKLRGIYDDNVQRDIAQLAIADFANPNGLEKVGETSFRESANSGEAQLDVSGKGRRGA